MTEAGAGRLILVATPIGNLGDLSPRAAHALRTADVVACEDTRRTGRLFELAGIERTARLLRLDEHHERVRAQDVLALLRAGKTVVVVSDAGTPGISDPGERVTRAALDAGFDVSAIPGPSAALAALVVSGLPAARFVFEGFLPRRGGARTARLEELRHERRTIIFYEAPSRVPALLADLAESFGATRPCAVAREITKLHEEVWRGSLEHAAARAAETASLGEHVIVVQGAPAPPQAGDAEIVAALELAFDAGLDRKRAVAEVAASLRAPKRAVYDASLRLAAHPVDAQEDDAP